MKNLLISMSRKLLLSVKIFIIQCLFLMFDLIIPADNTAIVFASDNGKRFAGNPKHLFLHLRNKPDIQCFWITTSPTLSHSLPEELKEQVIYAHSLQGWVILAKAGWVFISHGTGDYGRYPIHFTSKVVQLWHGKPYKNDGLLKPNITTREIQNLRKEVSKYYAMTASSSFCRYYVASAFGIDVNRILPFGYPRDIQLLTSTTAHKDKVIECYAENLPAEIRYVILYAPTYRDGRKLRWFPFSDFDYSSFNQWLIKHHAMLFLRAHVNDEQLKRLSYSNIQILDFGQCPDIYKFLPSVDVLISDYSSLYIDYLLLDRPVIFLDYDFDEFAVYRGISLAREFIAIGEHPHNMAEFISALHSAIENPNKDSINRRKVSRFFNEWSTSDTGDKFYSFILQSNGYSRKYPPRLILWKLQR